MTLQHQLDTSLPVKCSPHPDEWTESLLARMARQHGLRKPWRYDLEALRPSLPPSMQCVDAGAVAYNNEVVPRWAQVCRGGQIRYCPDCLAQSRFVRTRWRLQPLSVCTIHGLVLKSGAVEPAFSSNYKHPARRAVHEITEQEMQIGATCPTAQGLAYGKAVWAKFEATAASSSLPSDIAEALAWALLADRLVEAASKAVRGAEYPCESVPLHEHRAWWLNKHGLQIGPSQLQITGFLNSLPGPAHRRAVMAMLNRMIADEVRTRSVMSRMPLADLKAELLAVPGDGRSCGALPRALHPEDHLSFEATEAALGCAPTLLKHMISLGMLGNVKTIKFGRKTYVFVPGDEVRKARQFLENSWTYEEMLLSLGINRQAYWLLMDCGLIKPVAIHAWRRYPKDEISELVAKFYAVVRPFPAASSNLLPLMGDWLHLPGRVRSVVRQVLAEILSGSLRVYRDGDGSRLDAYWVDAAAPARMRWLSEATKACTARERSSATQLEMWAPA